MAAQSLALAADPRIGSTGAAFSYVASRALSPAPIGRVGLELEFHLVDRRVPARRLSWGGLHRLLSQLPAMPGGSRLTVEPGTQFELSTPPARDVASAVALLRRDRHVLAEALAGAGLGLASIGADPARPVRRRNPASRYVAMERHFDAIGCGVPGRAMMASTAALQVNLEAGPPAGWAARMRRMHSLGPVLVALSACSPLLEAKASGWQSMRQQVWGSIDPARCGQLPEGGPPEERWAAYALAAPVMMVRDPLTCAATPVTSRVSFAEWVAGAPLLAAAPTCRRAPTFEDLDYHLTTLFPPVRPRGFLEIRYLDAVPQRWWAALATLAVTLLDDEVAADRADEVCEPMAGRWTAAARNGLRDDSLARAARDCAAVAVERCPVELRPEVEAYAEMVTRRRTPGDDVREQAKLRGPLAVLVEETYA